MHVNFSIIQDLRVGLSLLNHQPNIVPQYLAPQIVQCELDMFLMIFKSLFDNLILFID